MSRWKRGGVIVVLYSTDHDPRHVHVFEDGRRLLNQEGVFDEKPSVQSD